jgi:hypothetical protein
LLLCIDQQGRLPIGCQFVTPIPDKAANPSELDRNEVNYWRRRLEAVTNEYRKWQPHLTRKLGQSITASFIQSMRASRERRDRSTAVSLSVSIQPGSALPSTDNELDLMTADLMDMSDTLFSSLIPPRVAPPSNQALEA